MNIIPHRLVMSAALLFATFGLFAQNDWQVKKTSFQAHTVNQTSVASKATPVDISSSIRYTKRLSKTHSGIVIELMASNLPLGRDYPLLRQFGNVHYHKLNSGGYSYVIKTNFTTTENAHNFLQNVVIHKAPEARVIVYKEGERKTL